ncbi:MAG: YihY family inner membrane protein [Candidatus Syntrophosphaera sp.]|nr:YihY family inner membrane protein [Candidatus Syntrophosphaera sp.]
MPEQAKKNIFKNIWETLKSIVGTALHDLGGVWGYLSQLEKRKKILGNIWSFLKELYLRIKTERVLREAGSLTYITIMGFIPFVVFILVIAPDLPFLNLKEKVFDLIGDNLMPTSALTVNNLIEGMLERRGGFNVLNFIVMIVSSYALFRVIRNTFDRVLRVETPAKQDAISQIVKFLGTIILGVFIMIILLSSSSLPLISRLLDMPLLRWLTYALPFIMQYLMLIFLYMLMPTIKIRRGSLIRGAFWTALIWALVKSGFDLYIYRMTNYQALYGALSALPIFLLWIYLNWVIILGGIVIVSVIEDRKGSALSKRDPNKKVGMVRVTLEMYSDTKLVQLLDRYFSKKEVKELVAELEDEEKEEQ